MIGIYKITNKLNGKFYIGQSNNIERRFSEHCQNKLKNRIPLDTVIQKYGKDKIKLQTLQAILWGRTYTNVPVYSKKKKQWINK